MNWQTKKLGNLCQIELGKTPYRGNNKFWDTEKHTNNVWLSIADLLNTEGNVILDSKEYISENGTELCKIVKEGTLLASFKLTLGRLAFAGKDLYTNEAIAALTIKSEKEISNNYLYRYLSFFDWHGAVKGDIKIKGKTLNKAKLKEIDILFPPLPEQHRIVKILDKIFEEIEKAKENTEKNLQNAKDLFDSYLRSIFTNSKWVEKTLKDISIEFSRGKSKHRPRNDKKLYGGKYPFIQTGGIRNSDHFINKYSQTYNEVGLKQSKLWPKGTICITIAANIAETGLLNFSSCFPDSVIGLIVDPKKANEEFVEYLLFFFKTKIKSKGKGSAQANINMGTFEYEKFPIPNLLTQKSIIKKLDLLSEKTKRLEEIYKQKLVDLEELKKTILKQAFEGKL